MNRTEIPVRTCIGCRMAGPVSDLYRIALEEDASHPSVPQRVVIDSARSIPGRGAWLHPNNDCFERALKKRAFARAFRIQGDLNIEQLRKFHEEKP